MTYEIHELNKKNMNEIIYKDESYKIMGLVLKFIKKKVLAFWNPFTKNV
jgi:hypothetical protein